MTREQMNIVIVGHVDHGKSTVIGRLLADTGSLPKGKLEHVKAMCERNARPFEYAFLLDALKDEQAQGITIDVARCFFKTEKRDYILIDAPGHIEFLKNMVTGASRAEAALLVIDAHEGIKENSKRHGYLLSMLGLRQVVVLVNKMDLVGYDMKVFEKIKSEYEKFLAGIDVRPDAFVPICARDGENIASQASWYSGKTVLELVDSFERPSGREQEPLRFPVQDVYKFTESNDDRRLVAGTIETGTVRVGDPIIFYPSKKKSSVKSIEIFSAPPATQVYAGQAPGLTLREELYIKPGEILCRADEPAPMVGTRLRVNLFWMGHAPLIKGKRYKLKLAAARVQAQLVSILSIIDATELTTVSNKQQVDRHDVAECIVETLKPVAFDRASENPGTGRFAIVDNYEIAGGGIILDAADQGYSALEEHIKQREITWESGKVSADQRQVRYGHKPKFVLVTGNDPVRCREIAQMLEERLFGLGHLAYYLGFSSIEQGLGSDLIDEFAHHEEGLVRLGELARVLTGSGHIFITALAQAESADIEILRKLNSPNEILIVAAGPLDDQSLEPGVEVVSSSELPQAVDSICEKLHQESIIPDYSI